jgi:hypothetical protein
VANDAGFEGRAVYQRGMGIMPFRAGALRHARRARATLDLNFHTLEYQRPQEEQPVRNARHT